LRRLIRLCSCFISEGDDDVDADLRAALAQEKLDVVQLVPKVRDTLRKLWEDDSCRQFLRGKWSKIIAAKIDWAALLREYDKAEAEKKNGETAVQEYVEANTKLTAGAASAVSRHVSYQIQLSRGMTVAFTSFSLIFRAHALLDGAA
jgi:hypothetical protein